MAFGLDQLTPDSILRPVGARRRLSPLAAKKIHTPPLHATKDSKVEAARAIAAPRFRLGIYPTGRLKEAFDGSGEVCKVILVSSYPLILLRIVYCGQ